MHILEVHTVKPKITFDIKWVFEHVNCKPLNDLSETTFKNKCVTFCEVLSESIMWSQGKKSGFQTDILKKQTVKGKKNISSFIN